jgi:WD40 repeat protein
MIKHRSPISGIDAFNGRYIATAGYDNQIVLWDAAAKRSIARSSHDHLANQCRFNPAGTSLVSASSDYSARLWHVPTLQLQAVLTGHEDDVEMAAFSPDGSLVATASRDNTAGIFGLDGRMHVRLRGHRSDVISVEWADGGRELVSSGDDGTVRRWSATTGNPIETIELDGAETDTIAIAGDGLIFAGNDDGDIILLGAGRAQKTSAHRAGIKRLLCDPGRRLLLSSSYDRTIRLWRFAPDSCHLECLLESSVPDGVWLRACCFLGDDQLAFGTFGSSYATFSISRREWNLHGVEETPGLNAVRMLNGSEYAVGDAGIVFRDGQALTRVPSPCNFFGEADGILVTGGQNGVLYDALTGAPLHTHRSPLNCCAAFQRDGTTHLIVGSYTGEGLIFVGAGGALRHLQTIPMHENAIKGVACNGSIIFSVCASGAAARHAISDFACVGLISGAHRKISNGAAALPDGRFASISRDLSLRVWSEGEVEEFPSPHDHSIKCVAASPRGSLVATGSYDGCIALFDWRERRWIRTERPTAAGISSLCPTEHQDVFRASSYDGSVYLVGDSRP